MLKKETVTNKIADMKSILYCLDGRLLA